MIDADDNLSTVIEPTVIEPIVIEPTAVKERPIMIEMPVRAKRGRKPKAKQSFLINDTPFENMPVVKEVEATTSKSFTRILRNRNMCFIFKL